MDKVSLHCLNDVEIHTVRHLDVGAPSVGAQGAYKFFCDHGLSSCLVVGDVPVLPVRDGQTVSYSSAMTA